MSKTIEPADYRAIAITEIAQGDTVRVPGTNNWFKVEQVAATRGRKILTGTIDGKPVEITAGFRAKVDTAYTEAATKYFAAIKRAAKAAQATTGKAPKADKPAASAKVSNKTADGKRQRTSDAMKLALAKLSNAQNCSLTRAEFGHVDPMILIGLDKRGWATLERAEGTDRQADLSTLTEAGKTAVRELLHLTAA